MSKTSPSPCGSSSSFAWATMLLSSPLLDWDSEYYISAVSYPLQSVVVLCECRRVLFYSLNILMHYMKVALLFPRKHVPACRWSLLVAALKMCADRFSTYERSQCSVAASVILTSNKCRYAKATYQNQTWQSRVGAFLLFAPVCDVGTHYKFGCG